MKAIRPILIALTLLSLLNGCALLNITEVTPSPTPTETPPPPPPPSPTPTPTPLPAVTTLTLWVPDFLSPYEDSTGAAILHEQLTAFAVIEPDVQVQVIVKKGTGSGGLFNMLNTAYDPAPDILPDLIVLNQHDLQRATDGGYVQPLGETTLQSTDFYPFAHTTQPEITTTYGIPFVALADHTAYLTSISVTPPFSWTDVLTKSYALLFPAGPEDGLADDALLAAYLGAGGTLTNTNGNVVLDGTVLEQLYGFIADMLAFGLINADRVQSLTDATASWEMYQQGLGRVSSVPAGTYWAAPSEDSLPSWFPTPNGAPIAIAHPWSMALVARDPFQQEAARKLLDWLTAPEQVAEFTRATRTLPARADVIELWGLLPEETTFLNHLLANTVANPPPSIDEPIRRALQAGLTALLDGEVETPEAAAAHALNNLRP